MKSSGSRILKTKCRLLATGLFCWVLIGLTGYILDISFSFAATGEVETTRDDKGVWFISGPDDASYSEIMEAMGYAVATDRLWQSELYRRQARGRLAEILGSSQLETDIYMRTLGYSDAELEAGFNALSSDAQAIINGYVAGFNRRVAEVNADSSLIPFEFKALGLTQVEQWSYKDVLCWLAVLQRMFDPEALETFQIDNMALFSALATAYPDTYTGMFNDLRWKNDPKALTYIPFSDPTQTSQETAISRVSSSNRNAPALSTGYGDAADHISETVKKVKENLEAINARVKMGSYAWVVGSSRSATGNPIIYSGPQMGFYVPSIVLEGFIQAGGLNISGMSVPGIPAIIIGRTPHHAWSMQVANAHTVDFYIENIEDVVLNRIEVIKVAGAEDVQLPVYRTSHGPVINPMPYDPTKVSDTNPAIAWKYSQWGYEFQSVEGFLKLATAKSMDQFGLGIELMAVSQHFCYADADGNIAYWMSGRDPVRPEGEWRVPQGMLGTPLEWDAATLIPRTTDRNTSQGYYCGWNNKSRKGYNNAYNSSAKYFGPFNRAHVIQDYLSTHDDLTYDQVNDQALNIATTDSWSGGGNPWKFVRDDFIEALGSEPTPAQQDAIDILEAWDGHFVAGGESEWVLGTDRADGWELMDAWIREVIRLTFADELTPLDQFENTPILFNVLLHGLAGESSGVVNTYNWFQNLSDPSAPQTADDIIVAALTNTLASLGTQPWGAGQRGLITYSHAMLGELGTTPYASRSTYAHCVEFGATGPVTIKSMFPLGESGTILMDAVGDPLFDSNFYTMKPIFDAFAPRQFPLFPPLVVVKTVIVANGSEGPVVIKSGTPVSIQVSLDPGYRLGDMADWWIAATTPFDPPGNWYSYVYPTGWMPEINRCVQTGLFSLWSFEVLNMALPVGSYTFYFAVDDPDGEATDPWWAIDSVAVTVE